MMPLINHTDGESSGAAAAEDSGASAASAAASVAGAGAGLFSARRSDSGITELCTKLGYSFKREDLLRQALTRKSAVVEGRPGAAAKDNQRLEFLGDRVIDTAISTILFEIHPAWEEGRLTEVKSDLVRNDALAELAESLELGKYLILGKSDKLNDVRRNTKALADVVESIFGAIYLDSGKDSTVIETLVLRHWVVLGIDKYLPATRVEDFHEIFDAHYPPEGYPSGSLMDALKSRLETFRTFVSREENAKQPRVEVIRYPQPVYGYYTVFRSPLQVVLEMLYAHPVRLPLIENQMRILLEHGADPDWQMGYRVLESRSMFEPFMRSRPKDEDSEKTIDHVSLMNELMTGEYKGPVNYQIKHFDRKTVLHMIVEAALEERINEDTAVSLIQLMFEYKANANLTDVNGKTPLQLVYDYQSVLKPEASGAAGSAASPSATDHIKLMRLLESESTKSLNNVSGLLPQDSDVIATYEADKKEISRRVQAYDPSAPVHTIS